MEKSRVMGPSHVGKRKTALLVARQKVWRVVSGKSTTRPERSILHDLL
jgi:hypothetical protein